MAKKTETKNLAKIITPKFRTAFPHVFKATKMDDADENAKKKYSLVMLYKKTQDLVVIKQALKHAKIQAFGPDKEDWPEDLESPVIDGDDEKYADYEGYPGHYAIKASTAEEYGKPSVVDENVDPILEQSEFYAGCYAIAAVYAKVWKFGKKRGIGFILDHVQKVGDGKKFGGKRSVEEVFSPVEPDGDDKDSNEDDDF